MLFGSQKILGLKIPNWLIPAFGLAISIAALIWTYHDVDLKTFRQDLATIAWVWVPVAAGADLFVYVWQSYRWNLLLTAIARIPLWRSVRAIYVGLFTNEILPMRPGEVIRSYLQARWSEIPFSVVVSSVIIERIFDGVWLILVFFASTFFVKMPNDIVDASRVLLVVVIAFAVFLAMVMHRKDRALALVARTRWAKSLTVLIEDLHMMCHSGAFYAAFLASLPYLLLQVAPIYALMLAYGLDLSVWKAVVVILMQRLATVLPQGPGNLGVLQGITTQALMLFEVDKTTAAGFSTLVWIVITLPLLVGGSVALVVTGVKFDELRHHARSMAPAGAAEPSPR